jgi:hypothetical protein
MELEQRDSDTFSERPFASMLSGCMYAAFVIAFSCGMLAVNAFLCTAFYAALPKHESVEISSRVGQLYYFIVPIVLLVVEWNLLDRVQRLFQR